ncbi:MAG: helix-turn-helix domain-containing protein [bacterium]
MAVAQSQPASALLREARRRSGLSQRRLARRAGTSQDAISRIERGAESPGLERLGRLLLLCGEELRLSTERLDAAEGLAGEAGPEMSAAERLRESASWNLVATKLEIAGAKARGGSAATRIGR